MGTAYRYLGLATMANGQYTEAQGYFQKSLEIFGEYFEGWDIAQSLTYLGDATLMSGDLAHAKEIYLRAFRLAKDAQSLPLMLEALAGIALYDARSGNYENALKFSYFVLMHPSAVQEVKDRAIQIKQELEIQFDDERIQSLKAGISNLSVDDVAKSLFSVAN